MPWRSKHQKLCDDNFVRSFTHKHYEWIQFISDVLNEPHAALPTSNIITTTTVILPGHANILSLVESIPLRNGGSA